ncbi:hypothetical protein N7462_009368 [Penicillium macrosclerotiorum]|uniref:uncharacterized protein n=1 Tax=Penicillium macrosclerotiorum TaxID=303699 RepID=UPI00254756A3|nr:uncharacterized protein N7462_009368 [Penicillium macrosclerotiorum]KAJ5673929.1 hypothetical protein N7462_009368 [Penicillium macrosclerotiorum]
MLTSILPILLGCLPTLGSAGALLPMNNVNSALRTRNGPGMTDADTLSALGRAFHVARSQDEVYTMNRTSLAKSWDGATLFTLGGNDAEYGDSSTNYDPTISIICSTCYVNGSVTGSLTLTGSTNFTQAVDTAKDKVSGAVSNMTDQLEAHVKEIFTDITSLNIDELENDLTAWPTLDVDVSLNNAEISDAKVHLEFDDLEMYLDLDIQLATGAAYTLNIYTSESPVGISVPGVDLGVLFSVDLILIAEAEIDIGSGIHIKLDDGLAFDLEMFKTDLSSITMPGGSYEILPVTLTGEGGSLQAVLSLKASVGADISVDEDFLPKFSAGVVAEIFAYVADFVTEVNHKEDADSGDCEWEAAVEYTLAVGAAAGATVAVDTYAWGPAPITTVPVWYTTLTSTCAKTKSASTTSTASSEITARAYLNEREDSNKGVVTTTVTSDESYTIVNCITSGAIYCPVRYQNTTSYTTTVTSTVTVTSGATATMPASIFASVTSPIAFGDDVKRMSSTSGSPKSYDASSATGGSSILNGTTDGTSNKVIIGLCVGLGVPFLAAIIVASMSVQPSPISIGHFS